MLTLRNRNSINQPPTDTSNYLIGKFFPPDKVAITSMRRLDFRHLKDFGLRDVLLENVVFNVRILYLNDRFHKAYDALTKSVQLVESAANPADGWFVNALFVLHNYRLMIHFLRKIKLNERNFVYFVYLNYWPSKVTRLSLGHLIKTNNISIYCS